MPTKTKEQLKDEAWTKYLNARFPGAPDPRDPNAPRKKVAWKTFLVDSEAVATTVANHANTPNLPYDFVELRVLVDGVEKIFTVADFKARLGF